MKNSTLTLSKNKQLIEIQNKLTRKEPISNSDATLLISVISQIKELTENPPLNEATKIKTIEQKDALLNSWVLLFKNLPGWDYCPVCFFVDKNNLNFLEKNVIIVAWYSPSFSYNSSKERPHEIWLKDDGTAMFFLPTSHDIEQYPELYNFKGTWKQAYFLLIETLKTGWPMEEFPEELQKFLKK